MADMTESRRDARARVLFTIGSAQRGGAEGQLVHVAARLVARGHQVRVVFLVGGGELTQVLDDAGIAWRVARPPIRRISAFGRNVLMMVRIAYYLFTWRPTAVMAWLPGAIWPTLTVARLVSPGRRIAALRGGTFERSRLARFLLRSAVRHAHVVTINAPSLMAEATELHAYPERVHFIANGVTLPAEPAGDVTRQPPVAVVVANYRPLKGHDVLLHALAEIDSPLHVRLLGVGDKLPEIRKLAESLGVGSKLTFVPRPADVAGELRNAQFAIHPSLGEGLSNAILEQLAAGLPVVATDVGGTPVLIDDGVQGLLVPPGDADALAAAIHKVAADAALREQMGAAARIRATAFSWEACIDAYEKLVVTRGVSRRSRP